MFCLCWACFPLFSLFLFFFVYRLMWTHPRDLWFQITLFSISRIKIPSTVPVPPFKLQIFKFAYFLVYLCKFLKKWFLVWQLLVALRHILMSRSGVAVCPLAPPNPLAPLVPSPPVMKPSFIPVPALYRERLFFVARCRCDVGLKVMLV